MYIFFLFSGKFKSKRKERGELADKLEQLKRGGRRDRTLGISAGIPGPGKFSLHTEILSKYYKIKLKSNCIYHFTIDLAPNGSSFGSNSIGKWYIQYDFSLI